ncbi:glutaminase [Halioglobus japonicus]|uniref:Glutaminase n=1 Tax=Halioglobus japonicus TaxID=930805 RepID=A0AAP8MD95_9GAMM|nr:glutaminase A [Halioglobus japonicus]AQA17740.1 glutaminase [Halioglobus japonicus]PLW85690.1 glutaminase [Halioglobus japonicus]GHD16980.1 glutaminase [Halioglobus japonicus]
MLLKNTLKSLAIVTAGLLFAGQALAGAITPEQYQKVVDEAYAKFKGVKDGANADYIPILAKVPSDMFGIALVTRDGKVYAAGEQQYEFSIQSVSKPFTASLIMAEQGPAAIRKKIGVEPTGLPFNSKMALELYPARSVNPLVNAGAIAAVSMVEADSEEDRWNKVYNNIQAFAARDLQVLEEVYESEMSEVWGNRAIANLLYNYGRLYADPEESLRVYTRQCSIGINTRDLGIMGATLANEGVNPITNKKLLDKEDVPELLAIMATAGFYDESGEWMYRSGLPAKTGVGGGIVAVVPGKFAIATFSPPLNEAGNSVRGLKAINHIAGELGVGLYGPNTGE